MTRKQKLKFVPWIRLAAYIFEVAILVLFLYTYIVTTGRAETDYARVVIRVLAFPLAVGVPVCIILILAFIREELIDRWL